MADTYQTPSFDRSRQLDGTPLAGFGRRAGALVADFFIAGTLFLLVSVGGPALAIRLGLWAPVGDVRLELTFFGNWYSVAWLVVYFSTAAYLGHGQTPGKRLFGIRVLSLTHDHLGFWHAVERALGYGASALEFGFGFLQYFLRADRRTVHDRIAETIVVRDPKPVRRATAPAE